MKLSIVQEFGIPLSTFLMVLKSKNKVLDGFQQGFSSQWKRVRGLKFPDVEIPERPTFPSLVSYFILF